MKNLGYESGIQAGVYTKVIDIDGDISKRIVVSRDLKKNNAIVDFFVSNIADFDAFDVLHYLKRGERLDLAWESSCSVDTNSCSEVAIYTYDVVKLGCVPSAIASLFAKRIESGKQGNIKMKIKNINSMSTKGAIEVRSVINLD